MEEGCGSMDYYLTHHHRPILTGLFARKSALRPTQTSKPNLNTNNLWRVLKKLTNKPTLENNIKFHGALPKENKHITNDFNRQITKHPSFEHREKKRVLRSIQKHHRTDTYLFTTDVMSKVISTNQILQSSRSGQHRSGNTETLGSKSTKFLTDLNLMNLSIKILTLRVPTYVWKVGRIIPVLKTRKRYK